MVKLYIGIYISFIAWVGEMHLGSFNRIEDNKKMQVNNKNNSFSRRNKKVFFFLRHNNDIDHITPVIYKWLSTENIPTDVIITSKKKFLKDYRIEYLNKYNNVRIFHINKLFKLVKPFINEKRGYYYFC